MVVVANGFDYGTYSCTGWAETFGITYPIIDGDANTAAWDMYGMGYIPHNVVLDHNMEVVYTSSGFSQSEIMAAIDAALEYLPADEDEDGLDDPVDNCPEVYNPQQEDIDLDGMGDACDICYNANVWVIGNTNGSIDTDGNVIVNIMDVLSLVDIILDGDTESCGYEASNITGDSYVNVIDVIGLVQMILNGDFSGTAIPPGDGTFDILHSEDGDVAIISSPEKISGFQFESYSTEVSIDELNKIVLPEGWSLSYSQLGEKLRVLAFDGTGQNPQQKIELALPNISANSFQNTVVSSPKAGEIRVRFSESSALGQFRLPSTPKIQSLYPNPFNPVLSVSFSIPTESLTKVAVYNTLGELVDVIENGRMMKSGFHTFYWDAADQSSGMYFIQVQTENHVDTKKAILVK